MLPYFKKTKIMTQAQQDYSWVQSIINSCNNDFHFDTVDAMITLFLAKHNDTNLADLLQTQRQNHWIKIHGIII